MFIQGRVRKEDEGQDRVQLFFSTLSPTLSIIPLEQPSLCFKLQIILARIVL